MYSMLVPADELDWLTPERPSSAASVTGAVIVTLIAVTLGLVFVRRLRKETGRVGDGFLLLAMLVALMVAAFWWTASLGLDFVSGFGLDLVTLTVFGGFLAVVGLLMANGVKVVRREGVGPTTILPAMAGLVLLIVPVATLWSLTSSSSGWVHVVAAVSLAAFLIGGYLGAHLIAYGSYALAHSRLPVPEDAKVVVTLGCGLRGDQVTPLLASRLDRALAMRAASAQSDEITMVVSGGQGPDEVVSEAAAMCRYLVDKGVPEDSILVEDRSTTTQENLLFSRRLLLDHGLGDESMVVSTNDFHAVRTAAIARQLGMPLRVVGSPTAGYYRPAALLREFVALLNMRRWWHVSFAAVIIAGVVVLALNS